MAKRSTEQNDKPLVIVESPAKARTISRFLGPGYVIEASIGHVRDLPEGAKQIPAKYKGEDWAYLGVNVNERFAPVYIIPPGKSQQVKKLQDAVKHASRLYLATDEDREGEAISWHLRELLKPKVPVQRLVFHEITKEAIQEALEHPRDIDDDLVRAQETRRIVDRLFGYEVSPLLWRKVRPRLSAGRVQSVAVRLIVDRERARIAFVSATYWDLLGTFAKRGGRDFQATLVSVDSRRLASSKDFNSKGQLTDEKLLWLNERQARDLQERLRDKPLKVESLEEKPYTSKPYAPFTTSTMQQEANRKLRFTARRTMTAAQSLYENGHITYMRTDSTNLAKVAIDTARKLIRTQYGEEYLPEKTRIYQTKVRNAQEAHEAIRPAGTPFAMPETLRSQLSSDEFKLYDLIWKRTVASQMANARGRRITLRVEGGGALFQVGGKTIDFPGYLRAYVEGSDDPTAELADKETVLPDVKVGEPLDLKGLESKSHTTQPPARFTEATLTRSLEEKGIGRPSTYASIIETILARDYVFKKGNALVPHWVAFAVSRLLESHLPELVDYEFTAKMEDDLDAISRGEAAHLDYLQSFYFGDGRPGLKKQLENKIDEIDARETSSFEIAVPEKVTLDGGPIRVRVGRYGPFLEQGDRRASLPPDLPPEELNLEKALDLLDQASRADEPLGTCPETGKPVFLKVGRFGPYVQRGTPDDDEKPKNASLLRGMEPEDVDLATALKLLSLPRELGKHPKSGEPVMAATGRFGPYVKCGSETRSLPADVSPLEVTLDEALQLLAQPKRSRRGAAKEPLKVFDESPVTGEKIQLLAGRYGPYVTDGETNASLPKDTSPEELTHTQAVDLLAIRAAKGPAKKRSRKKTTTKSSTAKKKTAKKKSPSKAAKKKTPAKKRAAGSAKKSATKS